MRIKLRKALPFVIGIAILLTVVPFLQAATPTPGVACTKAPSKFVQVSGTHFTLDGRPFYFAGTNCYYLEYSNPYMVENVLQDANAMNLNVVRLWGFLDAGFVQSDGNYANSVDGTGDKAGTVFQYYDQSTGQAVINNGSNGLVQLDYAIWRASVYGLKLVIPLTNYWYGMGGVPQYLTWENVSNVNDDTVKEQFFTQQVYEQLYMNYVGAILNRVNVYTGIQNKNDPTIIAWELMNEPRYPGGVTAPQFVSWVTMMSQFIKSIDSNHLVSVGDEGMGIGNAGTYGPPVNASDPNYWNYYYPWGNWEGYNWTTMLQIPTIDYGSVHLYPDWWTWWLNSDTRTAQVGIDYGTKWITDHAQISQQIGKPMVLGEYGWQNQTTRNVVFSAWLQTIEKLNVAGDMFWMLAGNEVQSSSNGTAIVPYPDYDGFTVYWNPSSTTYSTALLIQQHAIHMEMKNLFPRFNWEH